MMCWWCSVLLVGGTSATAADDAVVRARAEAIRSTLHAIQTQVRQHGGTWESWIAGLEPYRSDLRVYQRGQRRQARHGFVFLNASIDLHLADDVFGKQVAVTREEDHNARVPDELARVLKLKKPAAGETGADAPAVEYQREKGRPFEAILQFDRDLKQLGIDLIVAFIPSKLSVYPDYPLRDPRDGETGPQPLRAPADRLVSVAVMRLMQQLLEHDVEVIDLHTAFRDYRRTRGDEPSLYYADDSHWLNLGARVAAAKIAERLARYPVVRDAMAKENPFVSENGARDDKFDPDVRFIRDRSGGMYRDAGDSPIVMAGCSFQAYNHHLGAHCAAQVAHEIHLPVTLFTSAGLSSAIPLHLARDRHRPARQVVVVCFTERMLHPSCHWPRFELLKMSKTKQAVIPRTIEGVMATGQIARMSPGPDPGSVYAHYLMKFYLTDLKDAQARPLGAGDGVVVVVAMHNRRVLPVANRRVGDRLTMRLTSWDAVSASLGRLETGILDDVELEMTKPMYWGELPDQPPWNQEQWERAAEEP